MIEINDVFFIAVTQSHHAGGFMRNFANRLRKLEQQRTGGIGLPRAVMQLIVSPGDLKPEYDRVSDGKGHVWHRTDGESSDAFLARVESEVEGTTPPGSVSVLTADAVDKTTE